MSYITPMTIGILHRLDGGPLDGYIVGSDLSVISQDGPDRTLLVRIDGGSATHIYKATGVLAWWEYQGATP